MVFFTCNACGQSVKKAQVEKHYMTQCRNCEVLSCMDCGKDFAGDAYKEHTKCVSENEKYGGKNYKAPVSENKGEAKQQQWLQRVRDAKDTAKLNPAVAQLLDKVADYPNVPRKKAKFENFMYNSLRVHNKSHVEQVWNIFSQAGVDYYKDLTKQAAKSNNNNNESKQTTENGQTDSATSQPEQTETNHKEPVEETDQTDVPKKKKKKKKDKENPDVEDKSSKKRKHQGDPEVPVSDEEVSRTPQDSENKKHKKCKKKHKHDKTEQISEETLEQVNGKSKKHKKRRHNNDEIEESDRIPGKRKRDDEDEVNSATEETGDADIENGQEQIQTKKFKWNKVIISVLQDCPDHQLPIKKLRKKVLNEYHACGGDVRIKSKEELRATFEKKVNKNSSFKVHKEIVKLVN